MNVSHALKEFEELARRLDIDIRYTDGGPSGFCTLKGKKVLFLDRMLDESAQLGVFIEHFKTINLEELFVVPVIKQLMRKENTDADW